MKRIICIASIVLGIVSCTPEAPKDYVTLSGKITDKNSDYLAIRNRGYQKKINVNEDGSFSDTLKIKAGSYSLFDGKESTAVYLKNGFDLKITLDTKLFDETVSYAGVGEEVNNYLAAKALLRESVLTDESLFLLEKNKFDVKIEGINKEFKNLLDKTKNIDSSFAEQELKGVDRLTSYISKSYKNKQYLATVLAKGNESPKFIDLENFKGGKTSLDDLKGKYVYVDVWATWCGPCKAEIPHLKKIEKEYHNKNIEFVSLSIDRKKDHEAWKKMIVKKELGGIQLFGEDAWKSSFAKEYRVTGIPRFILIDPAGNIVSADAPRPSSKALKTLFGELSL